MAPTITRIPSSDIDTVFARTTNLASSALNARILSKSDDFFASADNLLNPKPPVHKPDLFVETGKWYDGWETRRHNPEPYDWVVIKLGVSGARIRGVEVDTAYFTGNYGEKAALEGVYAPGGKGGGSFRNDEDDGSIAQKGFTGWKTILPPQECGPSQRQAWKIEGEGGEGVGPYTHVRLLMYPDGGFARLRLYGEVIPPPPGVDAAVVSADGLEELSSALMGGVAVAASDEHYTPASNLLLPGRGVDMSDGWETARSRAKDHVDWAIIRLGLRGTVSRVVVDTKDFRGNFPREVRVHGFVGDAAGAPADPSHDDPGWVEILKGSRRTQAHTEHAFEGGDLAADAAGKVFSHVKLTLVPDGGVKRLRIFGRRAQTLGT
ncbi:hypothetical protein VTN31DRAFT_1265 [Thermomyces dupontii]|uniref:uncharacterized protein n=1 Tax=Talaromyces thermophilus TaxID=28565 RepID=UPI003742AC08